MKCRKCGTRERTRGRWYVMTNIKKKSALGTDAYKVVWICRNGHVVSLGWTKPLPDQVSVTLNDGNLEDVMTREDVDEE